MRAGARPDWADRLASATNRPERQQPVLEGRAAAVLLLLAERGVGPEIVLLERGAALRQHAGQPAFPGGSADPSDSGPVSTALREAWEEIGVAADEVDVLGTLEPILVAASGFVVTPVLAHWPDPGILQAGDPVEVAAVHSVPVAELADPGSRLRLRHPNGSTGAAFQVRGMLVWGFTAGLLDRLLGLAGWERPWNQTVVAWPSTPSAASDAVQVEGSAR